MSEKLNQEELERLARYRELEQLRRYLGLKRSAYQDAYELLIAAVTKISSREFRKEPILAAIAAIRGIQQNMKKHTDGMVRDLMDGSWRLHVPPEDDPHRIHYAEGKDDPTN